MSDGRPHRGRSEVEVEAKLLSWRSEDESVPDSVCSLSRKWGLASVCAVCWRFKSLSMPVVHCVTTRLWHAHHLGGGHRCGKAYGYTCLQLSPPLAYTSSLQNCLSLTQPSLTHLSRSVCVVCLCPPPSFCGNLQTQLSSPASSSLSALWSCAESLEHERLPPLLHTQCCTGCLGVH